MAKILVADDEQMIREVIREYSEFNGHEITEAADGMAAVGLCKMNDFDLVIRYCLSNDIYDPMDIDELLYTVTGKTLVSKY